GRHVDPGVGIVRYQAIGRADEELLRLPLRTPTDVRYELEFAAQQDGWQKHGELKAVLLRRREERQGAVQAESMGVRRRSFHLAHEAVEFDASQKLAVALRRLPADGDPDLDGAQEDGLREGDVVALEQVFGTHVLEGNQALFALEIGKQRAVNFLRSRLHL